MLESYITPMLMSYISKYVKNLKPSDLQVSFWGGDAVLRNLELRLDVLEQELRYPLEIKSGRIRELVLHIPWNAILSKPVEAVIKDVEIVVKLKDVRHSQASKSASQEATDSAKVTARSFSEGSVKQSADQSQPGYLQGYMSRILNNLIFHVQNLVVKVIEEECDMAMSFNIQSLKYHMTDERWTRSFVYTDCCQGDYELNKLLEVSDMVVYLQTIDSDGIHKATPQEPFVRKCTFSCRMQSLYRGKKFAKRSTCVLFETIVFSADESQFSLFLHLLDWLLAMYYSGKKLKGRDDVQTSARSELSKGQQGSSTDGAFTPSRAETVASSFEDVLLSGSVGGVERECEAMQEGGGETDKGGEGGGWGSWVWSFVAVDESEGEGGGEGRAISGAKEGVQLAESYSFAIIVKSITVNLKVTHHGRVPVFSSLRSLSRAVLTLLFTGCSLRVDSVPSTQLFAVSVGIMAMEAAAHGFCSCADPLPAASWKTTSEPHEKVTVFSLGDVSSYDRELVLRGSLFDPDTSSRGHLPPLAEHLLAAKPEYTAVWFTYEYYDVGREHAVEVCTERLSVGEIAVLLSPDVVHRVTYFTSAYGESLKAYPLFSEGMVVIGDPKAETTFKIALAGVRATVTTNTHYLPFSSTFSSPSDKSKSPLKQPSHAPPPLPPLPPHSPPLPALCVTLDRSTINITSAMYGGNACLGAPQRHQLRANFNQLEISEIENFVVFDLHCTTQLKKILSVPKLEIYRHLKTTVEDDTKQEDKTSYLQLDLLDEVSCVISPEQVAKANLIYSSWYSGTPPPNIRFPRAKFDCAPTPLNSGGHLHISVRDIVLTKSVTSQFTFLSLVVTSCSVVLLQDSVTGRLCHAVPVLCSPLATGRWNTREAYMASGERLQCDADSDEREERFVEFFTTIPDDNHSVDSYPTLQLLVGGVGVCLDAAVLEFVKHITHHLPRTQLTEVETGVETGVGVKQTGSEFGVQASHHSGETVTMDTPTPSVPEDAMTGDEHFAAKLKLYAAKVDMKPILIVLPAKPLDEGLTSSHLPEFPVLPALRENSLSMEALVVCLPHLSLKSAKSHVLDEPVPKSTSTNTLPWDCTLRNASIIAVHCSEVCYVVDPLTVTSTLADQQGGTGVTVHADTISVALSSEKAALLSLCVSTVMDALSPILSPEPSEQNEDSGIHSNYNPPPTPHPLHRTPSHLSSPAHSTITTATATTLPAHTSLSTTSTSSLHTYHSFTSLWIQAIISKITLTLFASLPRNQSQNTNQNRSSERHNGRESSVSAESKTSSRGSYKTPLTSPVTETGEDDVVFIASSSQRDCGETETEGEADIAVEVVKLSLEVDGISVQFDVQEKCTDLVLKVAAVDANLHSRQGGATQSQQTVAIGGGGVWRPYLSSEKILSSRGSALPPELSQILTLSSPAAVHLPQGRSLSSASLRNFVTLELTIPHLSPHRATKLKLKVQSFEAVVWLPIVDVVSSIASSLSLSGGNKTEEGEVSSSHQGSPDISSWLAVEASVDCCRLVLPSLDYTNSILCNIGRVVLSNNLDYPATDVRYVVSASAFRRLTLLSSEKKQPPLPVYQMDVLSMSVWGVRRGEGECAQVLLYVGSCDVRVVFTPALYWVPTGISYTSQRPAILACGHCAEVNFRTDLSLMIGPAQVDCISTVFRSNMFSRPPATPTKPPPTSSRPHPPVKSTPFKGFVTGNSVGLTLVSTLKQSEEEEEGGGCVSGLDSASESSDFVFSTLHGLEATVVPLVQIQLFNPLCSMCGYDGGCRYEVSCFNMAVGCSDGGDGGVCSYSDLVDAGVTSSLLDSPLLETRQGQPVDSREIPPSVVAMTWDVPHHKPAVVSFDINRPIKLTLTSQLIQRLSEFSSTILKAVHSDDRNDTATTPHSEEHVDIPHTQPDLTSGANAQRTLTVTESVELSSRDASGKETIREVENGVMKSIDGVGVADVSSFQVKASAVQVLVEFQLSSRVLDTSAADERESFMSLVEEEGGASQVRSVSVAEEGLVLMWEHVTLAYPNVTNSGSTKPTCVSGDIHITGLQALTITDCTTSPVILPTQLNCFFLQHIPTSSLDLPYVNVNLSCGLLEVRLSCEVIDVVARVLQTVTGTISLQGEVKGHPPTVRTVSEESENAEIISFHDDLRAGDFTYIIDADVPPGYSPQPGEIFFSLGSQCSVTAMEWHYREPRALTKLSILPVPFSFTSEEDAPIDISVGCTLDYWDEDNGTFSVLEEFRLSETTPTEVLVSRVIGSRKWRIAIVEVEWEDDEEGERFVSRADVVNEEGAPVPIASVLSPISLAGCTCVDSYFSPHLVPVSDLSLTCHSLKTTLLHNMSPHPGWYEAYEVTSLTSGAEELMRLSVDHMTCHLKQMRNSDTFFEIDGHPSIEFIDFLDLTWRVALHPTHLHGRLEKKKYTQQIDPTRQGSRSSGDGFDITVKCSPAVVCISQGLLHTTSLALHLWTMERKGEREGERKGKREGEMEEERKGEREGEMEREREGEGKTEEERERARRTAVILNHFILCNDTLQVIHFGQVSTNEVVGLRSGECMGYSWRNHLLPHTLHMCVVSEGVWRWTKPFTITHEGTQSVEVFIGRHTALVSVCVANIGGLQKQVTLTGSWKFFSTLPFPLHLSLVATRDTENTTDSKDDDPTLETFLLPPKMSLPSLVVPAECLSGVRVRSPHSTTWSDIYPIHSATDDWSKPQLLTEMEYCSGQRVNLWYNINPMYPSKLGPSGSRITFSPLFAVCNHLPFDLTMVATETNATGPAPTSLPECLLKGEGEETILCGLQADTWFHMRFKQSEAAGVSEPTISLSTFLLVHLPFSATSQEEREQRHKWPYEDNDTQVISSRGGMATSIEVKLPLDNGACCSLHAILERNPTNTITLHLQPDVMVVNRSPIPVQLLTRSRENNADMEDDGTVELVSKLNPNEVELLPQNKFYLRTEWKGKTLLSEPVIADPNKDEHKKEQQPSDAINVVLTERESGESFRVFCNLTLVRRFKGSMTVISVLPSFTLHNSTPYDLKVSTYQFYVDTRDEICMEGDPLVVEHVESLDTKPLLFREQRDSSGPGETVHVLALATSTAEDSLWSIPLSPDFVRHSFALPASTEQYLQAVLTTHENANTVYLVVAEDPAPRLLIQNLTQQILEMVEEGTRGIHKCSQILPPSQQVTYDPPTYAKQYPIVFDPEVVQSRERDMQKKMARTSVKFRLRHAVKEDATESERVSKPGEWSETFRLASDSDRIISIPDGDSILISTHRKGTTLYLSLLPTGLAAPLHPTPLSSERDSSDFLESGSTRLGMTVNLKLAQLVLCICDEMTAERNSIEQVLQVIADGAALQFNSVGRKGTTLDLSVESLHINNMTETEVGDFAVTVIPRREHVRRPSLIESDPIPLARLSVHYSPECSNLIEDFRIIIQPLTLQLEDGLLNRLKTVFASYGVPGILLHTPNDTRTIDFSIIPESVLAESKRDVVPLAVTRLTIEPAAFYLNARISFKVLLSCNDSPFRFSRYELENVYSNWTEVSQTVASHYVMSTIAHIGWLLGSLELIGSPAAFIQNVGRGLRDLVTLPYQGLTRSPTWFLLGIGRGTMSFVHHLSSGALHSVTSMASSISHNMERLSFDPHHISYQTQHRQERPVTHFTMGLVSGVSSFGLSLMSAVAGIVEQPMQSYHQMEGPASPTVAARSILKGVGKGLLGAVTKPVGGAMELVSQTGKGLMHGTGLVRRLRHKTVELQCSGSLLRADLQPSSTACAVKLGEDSILLLNTPVQYITSTGTRNPAVLLLTPDRIYLLDSSSNTLQQNFSISEYSLEEHVSGANSLEEVEIVIVARTLRAEMPKFHQVEYFLSSNDNKFGKSPTGLPQHVERVPTHLGPDLSNLEIEVESCDQQLLEREECVKLLIATHCAAQLLSFYNSLSVHPHTAFCAHRALKSKSFFSAKSD